MTDETTPRAPRRLRNALIPALIYGALLFAAGIGLWIWLETSDAGDRGFEYFQRMALLAVSIGLASFLCRTIANAQSPRLGLLKPEPGDFGAVGWFGAFLGWGMVEAEALPDASLGSKLMQWIRVGLLESPVYVVFGYALVATVVFCLLDLGVRRVLGGRG